MPSVFVVLGALLGGLAVAAGAFGAHSLQAVLSERMLAVFETGVRYQMYHALALIIVGWVGASSTVPWFRWSGWAFVAGTLLFSGSLYVLALTGTRWWGAVTPLGGVALLLGWAFLAVAVWRQRNQT